MRLVILIAILLFVNAKTNAQSTNKEYDSVLAKKLNADAYGMKKYYLVLLKTGTANITDKAKLDSILPGI